MVILVYIYIYMSVCSYMSPCMLLNCVCMFSRKLLYIFLHALICLFVCSYICVCMLLHVFFYDLITICICILLHVLLYALICVLVCSYIFSCMLLYVCLYALACLLLWSYNHMCLYALKGGRNNNCTAFIIHTTVLFSYCSRRFTIEIITF